MAEAKIPKIKTSGVSSPTKALSQNSPLGGNVQSATSLENTTEDREQEEAEEQNLESEENQEEESSGPHFDAVDTFFYVSLAVMGDIFDGIWVTRIFFAPMTVLFLYLKGVDQMISKNMMSQGIELIPVVGWLPISTTMAIYTVVITNHPELLDKLGVAGDALKKVGEVSKKKKI